VRPINVEGVSQENADAEKEADGCNGLGHSLAPWLEMAGMVARRNSRASKRWLNAFTMAGSHGLVEVTTTSVAWIRSASQTMLGSALGKAGRPVMIASRCFDLGGHRSTGSFPDDFVWPAEWFRRIRRLTPGGFSILRTKTETAVLRPRRMDDQVRLGKA
jgi:hypothetical protein